MLPFNDNAKFMIEVHGFFMNSFQVKVPLVFHVYYSYCLFETKDDAWAYASTARLFILSIPMPKTIASDCLASFFSFSTKEKKVQQSPIVSFGN
jgi:hypothetical protein